MGPLEGIKIIDISTIVSGPLAASMLGDQGAEVIKIEPPFAYLPEGYGLGIEPDLDAINHYLINKAEVLN